MHRPGEGEIVDAQERPAALAQIFHRKTKHNGKHQHGANHDIGVTILPGIFQIKMERIELQGSPSEVNGGGLLKRSAPMMVEDSTDLKLFKRHHSIATVPLLTTTYHMFHLTRKSPRYIQ